MIKTLLLSTIVLLSACAVSPSAAKLTESDRDVVIQKLWEETNKQVDEAFRSLEAEVKATGSGVAPVSFGPETPAERRLMEASKMHRDCFDTHLLNITNTCTAAFKRRNTHGRGGQQIVDFTQGQLSETGQPYDLAINGEGLFRITLPDGRLAYTRSGNFMRDSEGNIVNCEGYRLEPAITIPENAVSVTVDECGVVSIVDPATPDVPSQVGQIEISRFADPTRLTPSGDSFYFPSGESGSAIDGFPGQQGLGFGRIRQGFLEESNVDNVREEVDMIMDCRMAVIVETLLKRAGQLRPDRQP